MRGIARVAVLLAAIGSAVAVVNCSLDLDEAAIDRPGDGGNLSPDSNPPDPNPVEGGVDTGVPVGPDASACTTDDPCKTNHACLKGRCDLTRKSCVYDVCRTTACNASVCDVTARTCGAAAPYKYKATQFAMGEALLCPVGNRCTAAIHPWLFALTATGVAAFSIVNPTNATPAKVPIVGLGFIPLQMVQSGSRVWLIGGPSGLNPSRVPLAYIDAPADPFTTKIVAHSVLVSYNRPGNEGISLLARGGDSALFVGPVAQQYPATPVDLPLVEPVTLAATALQFTTGTAPVAMSGKRLLMSGIGGGVASFNFVEKPGELAPVNLPATNVTDAGPVSNSRAFAQTADGAIFWATGVQQGEPATTRAVRGYFLVGSDTGPIEVNVGVDIEVFDVPAVTPGPNDAVVGPIAMLDAKTVLVPTKAKDNDQQTAVQFVSRDPLGVVKEGTGPRRQVLPVPLGAFAAATASNGVGYLVSNEGDPAIGQVYVFDPACAP